MNLNLHSVADNFMAYRDDAAFSSETLGLMPAKTDMFK